MRVRRLFIYPVKSLLPIEVDAAELTSEGLRFDRQYVIVKPPKDPMSARVEPFTIKNTFNLCLLQPSINAEWSRLTITDTRHESDGPSLSIPLTPSPVSLLNAATYRVPIFGTAAWGVDMGDAAADFFTSHLGQPARLAYIAGSGRRDIPGVPYGTRSKQPSSLESGELSIEPQRIRFADAAPLSITTTASEKALRQRLPPENRSEDLLIVFRSNIHFESDEGMPPFDEDDWKVLHIRSAVSKSQVVVLKCIFKCVRCLSVNVDRDTGGIVPTRRQLYGLMARDRRVNDAFPHRPVFGQYAFAGPANSILRVGDQVELVERE